MPLFSVIIPLYNKEKYILRAVQTVINQSYNDFELIIIDDGSTDRSMQLAQETEDPRLRVVSQQNRGAGAARNTGIMRSSAPYLCFLDADDEWHPTHLQVLYELIGKFPDAALYCSRYRTLVTPHRTESHAFDGISQGYEGYIDNFFASSVKKRVALTSAVCVARTAVSAVGLFDEKISSGQDLDYWIRLALHGKVALSREETVTYHYELPQSLSKRAFLEKKLPDFGKFAAEESESPIFKKFLDVYRLEYALHYHLAGDKVQKDLWLKNISCENIPLKVKVLLNFPARLLRNLLYLKRWMRKKGIDFSVYH